MCVGMIVGLILRQDYEYHGPNSNDQRKKIYYSKQLNKCIIFDIKLI